jgi:putative tricarboxylic transport membrane protein
VRVIRHPRDFWAGVLFIAMGGSACAIALSYAMGTASRMGPGYFPRVLGVLLAALGAALVLRSFRLSGAPLSFPTLKPLFIVLTSVLLFGLIVAHLGLALATVVMVLYSSVASHEYRWKESVLASVALAVFVVIAFRYGLELQLPTWPPAIA